MTRIGRLAAALAAAALLAALPATAGAATRSLRIRPGDLSPFAARQDDARVGIANGAGTGTVLFWKTLRLPRGATITGVSYRRLSSSTDETIVGVDRVRPDAAPAWQRIYEAASTVVTPTGTGATVTGTPTGVSRRVARGWTYFVLVKVTTSANVGDIVVRYATP